MNEEEKKAVEELSKKAVICNYEERDYPNMICFKKDMIIALNLIEKLQKELKQKDKIIDLMAETINNIDEDICKQMGQKANCNEFEDTEKCKDCIKQYFENKAKEIK